jgi:hypothetical protein
LTKADVQSLIVAKAAQYGVPSQIALGVAAHESGFNDQAIGQNKDAFGNPTTKDWGVMQLNDTTVRTMGVSNPLDAEQNVDAGVRLLASLLNRYGGDAYQALWAYASGPGNVGPGKTPNTIARNFIAYVMAYQGGAPTVPGSSPITPSVTPPDETPSEFIEPGILTDSSFSDAGTVNWGLLGLLGLGLLAVWWFNQD